MGNRIEVGPLDYSQLSEYGKCKRRFYYIYRRGLLKKVGPAAHWSKMVHEALSNWWFLQGQYEVDWDSYYKEFIEANGDQPDDYYTLELGQLAYRNYIKKFGGDLDEYEVITTETKRHVSGFSEPGFITKPDLVLLRRRDSVIFVKDFKLSKYSKTLVAFDRQFLGQVMGFGAGGFSIDACKISNTKKGLSAEWFRDEQEVRGDLLVEWYEEAKSEAEDIARREKSGVWPKAAPDACVEYGDRHLCPFIYICEAGEFKETVIESAEKKENPWDYQE